MISDQTSTECLPYAACIDARLASSVYLQKAAPISSALFVNSFSCLSSYQQLCRCADAAEALTGLVEKVANARQSGTAGSLLLLGPPGAGKCNFISACGQ